MRLSHYTLLYIVATLWLAVGCDNTPIIETQKQAAPNYKENIINANRVVSEAEHTQIEGYISRRGWAMTHLPDGASFDEYQRGAGNPLSDEDTAVLQYSIETLTGQTIYSHRSDTIIVGHHQPNLGIDQTIKHLRRGSKARIILPSSLAYGMVGDGDRVPAMTVLVYDMLVQ
ncbi:MAG: FKBP-type peptidyl-prolyl cis-trans isomerase [Bacteroidales bacterium]|nr:FKBP-type peptidyl-prolyl cis-trans isomerase [Bacteroidales bacterium]